MKQKGKRKVGKGKDRRERKISKEREGKEKNFFWGGGETGEGGRGEEGRVREGIGAIREIKERERGKKGDY